MGEKVLEDIDFVLAVDADDVAHPVDRLVARHVALRARRVARGLADVGGAQNVLITSYEKDPSFEFRTMEEIAKKRGIGSTMMLISNPSSSLPPANFWKKTMKSSRRCHLE